MTAIWAALRQLDLATLRTGSADNDLLLVLDGGPEVPRVKTVVHFYGIDWDRDTAFTRVVNDCWKRGQPI